MSTFVWRRPAALNPVAMEPSISASPDRHAAVPFWPRFRNAVALLSVAVVAHVWVVPSPLSVPEPGPVDSSVRTPQPSPSQAAAASVHPLPDTSVLASPAPSMREPVALTTVAYEGSTSSPSRDVRSRHSSAQVGRGPRTLAGDVGSRALRAPVPVGTTGVAPVPGPYRVVNTEMASAVPSTDSPETGPGAAPLPLVAFGRTPPAAGVAVPSPVSDGATRVATDGDMVAAVMMGRTAGPAVPPGVADPTVDRMSEEKEGVLRVLQQYKQAYERLDVKAAQAVRPSVNGRDLERAFRGLDGQEIRFGECRVLSVAGPKANATCQTEATYRPKIGNHVIRVAGGEWTFSLSRHEDRWQIVKADLLHRPDLLQ